MSRRCKIRRSVFIFLILAVIMLILYYELTKTPTIVTEMKLPRMPDDLRNFLKESRKELKDSIDKLIRTEHSSALAMNEYFKNVDEDGFNLNWIHSSEFRIPLQNESNAMLDLNSLMDKSGYISAATLDTVLKEGRHGLHLRMGSLGQAKVALAALMTRPYQIKTPVLISAPVMQGPNINRCRKEKLCAYSEPLLVDSFLTLIKRELKAQLGLSWTEFYDSKNVNQGYTWPMVVKMFELTREVRTENMSVLFMVRATLGILSIPQLKWLITVTRTKLVLEAGADDAKSEHLHLDIALIYSFIPKSSLYLRVPAKLKSKVKESRSAFTMPSEWQRYKDLAYKDAEWTVMRDLDQKYFLRSDEAILMYPAANHPIYLGSVKWFKLTRRKMSNILGRVVFFEDSEHLKTGNFKTGLKIFIGTDFGRIEHVSTQALIGSNGYFSVSSYSTKRDVIMNDHKMNNVSPCYQFLLEVEPRGVDMTVSSPIDCNYALDQKFMESTKIRLDITLSTEPFRIFLQPVGKESLLVDQFSWKE